MTQQEFIEFIDIDQKGHYPFQCFAKQTNGKTFLAAMALPNIESVYFSVNQFLQSGVEFLHFSADFPKHGSMESDFVAIHTIENGKLSCVVLLPYDENGSRMDLITEGKMVDSLSSQAAFCLKYI